MYRFYADREYVANKDNKFKETNYNNSQLVIIHANGGKQKSM